MMNPLIFIPAVTFAVLLAAEFFAPRKSSSSPHRFWDWIIHLSGFLIQGAVIPLFGYVIASSLLPLTFPSGAGVISIGWWGAFLLNFVLVDFLYYWQHRWFHRIPWLWKLHLCHHTAKKVNIWVTSRNTLLLHFLFVYFLCNPFLGYLVSRPDGFFAGAMLTASLDIFRHANIDTSRFFGKEFFARILGTIFVLSGMHHRHHGSSQFDGNFGANFILWDRIFGTFLPESGYPEKYGVEKAPTLPEQWLYPLNPRSPDSDAS